MIFSPATSIAIRTALTVGQPDEPEIPTTIAGYMFGRDVVRELDIQQFDIQPFPGKGIGVVARFNIAKGTLRLRRVAGEDSACSLASEGRKAEETMQRIRGIPQRLLARSKEQAE